MAMRDKEAGCLLSICLGIFLWALIASFGWLLSEAGWRFEAVKHGAAEYDSQTGAWKWKEPKPQEPKGEE